MEQQIANILAQTTTKTRKIQQLLMLGLTRRQVADLVTNGNYGFVQNVYARMNLAHQPEPTALPVLDYTFNRRFGIEIEAYNCRMDVLVDALREEGIQVSAENYNHTTRNHWKLVTDSSLSGNNTFELVSPVLEGQNGLKELKKVCWVLDACGVKVNASCGLHIHFDAANFSLQTWKNIAISYKHIESVIDKFMPESRRNNNYCRSLRNIIEQKINNAQSIDNLQQVAFENTRYFKVNPQSYSRHKTIEFRQHAGSINYDKISNWVLFLNGLVTFAQQQPIASGTVLNDIPFLSDEQKSFFRLRTKKLNS
ncbi:amidoligase family protein [Parabacteroides gordonii]|jgi:hypothetical protein|uniref:amidoligase family protein n=1 Tax=Parabacteroides gordonii TaxID=574930 RepID=UPI002056E8C3|nr:amidoligase family protein [Parabacteroides gordonii]DAV65168.1 MAG TPA: Putative amidoligase enzyme [Caudoviricetes sp.]